MEEDNKLVGLVDLEKEEHIPTKWDDVTEDLKTQMQKLQKLRFNVIPNDILDQAMNEIIIHTDWIDYENFKESVKNILEGPVPVPFSSKVRDKETGNMDFWILRTFINVKRNPVFINEFKEYNKREVYMSKEFSSKLRKYCKDVLKDEVQFWIYTNSPYGTGQKMDISKLSQNDKTILTIRGDSKTDELILFQFKKKNPEILVGRKN